MQHLAFHIAEKAGLAHPFNKQLKMVGREWVKSFLDRHDLRLRQPQ